MRSVQPSVLAPRVLGLRGRVSDSLLLILALLGATCGTDAATGPGIEPVVLDVQVHRLRSAESDALTTTLTEQDIERLFAEVNSVWNQAGIEWRVASILDEEATNGDRFEAAFRGQAPGTPETITDVIPRDNVDPQAWHVFFVRDLGGGAGGIYFAEIPAVLQAEIDPFGVSGPNGAVPRILAHELGHALSLRHVPCSTGGNLMAAGCSSADRTRLDVAQIEAARAQAVSGPYRGR